MPARGIQSFWVGKGWGSRKAFIAVPLEDSLARGKDTGADGSMEQAHLELCLIAATGFMFLDC